MRNILKTLFAVWIVSLFVLPVASYADWHGGHGGGGHFHGGGFHNRSFIGVNFSVWPDNYYYGGYPYYPYYPDGVLVSPPVTVIQPPPVVVDNQASAAPAQVITAPDTTSDAGDTFTINIPNDKGGFTAVILKRSGNGFIGPQGEFYPEFPKVSQLRVIYGK